MGRVSCVLAGTELWEATLRNGGQPPPQVQQKTPWGHTPATNIGGTWGEDDEGKREREIPEIILCSSKAKIGKI